MVMEAPPSPQCVGREFVRQYYTLLNKAPAHLHRFYNNNSSFVHGGLDSPNRETKPVVGQKQIHQKIQQLNFRDCHAKISQVDSQATLGDGVVVQVTGELSNSGQPMRRFTQTFVLAAQTPKKFYVHNDIFRYQDMLFCDEDTEGDSIRSEAEEELEQEHSPNPDIIHANAGLPQHAYYNNTTSSVVISPQPTHLVAPPPPAAMAPPQTLTIVNGQAHPDEVAPPAPQVMAAPIPTVPVMAQQTPALPPLQPQAPPEPEEEEGEEEEPQPQPEEVLQEEVQPAEPIPEEKPVDVPEPHPQPPVHHTPETVSNEPKTYATLVKSGGPLSFASAASGSMNMMPMKPVEVSPPPVVQRNESMGGTGRGGPRPTRGLNQVRGIGRPDRQSNRPSFNEDSPSPSNGGVACGVGDGIDRRPRPPMGGNVMPGSQYTDSQQLFLGKLPHSATEEDLKELFSKYGNIIDLRIHSKPNAKGTAGNRVPNYGFIIFEDASVVQRVLDNRPFWFPNEGPNGMRLNVEEKQTRSRHSLDSGRDNRDNRDGRDNRDSRDSRDRNMSDSRNSDNQSRSGGNDPRSGGNMGPRGGGGMRGGPGGPRGQRGGFSRGGGGIRGGGQFQQRR